MGGVTIAIQAVDDESPFSAERKLQAQQQTFQQQRLIDQDDFLADDCLLAEDDVWAHWQSAEDLTEEVEDLIMSESLEWDQATWNTTSANGMDLGFDPALYASALPFGDLFGANELSPDFDGSLDSGLYDEMTCEFTDSIVPSALAITPPTSVADVPSPIDIEIEEEEECEEIIELSAAVVLPMPTPAPTPVITPMLTPITTPAPFPPSTTTLEKELAPSTPKEPAPPVVEKDAPVPAQTITSTPRIAQPVPTTKTKPVPASTVRKEPKRPTVRKAAPPPAKRQRRRRDSVSSSAGSDSSSSSSSSSSSLSDSDDSSDDEDATPSIPMTVTNIGHRTADYSSESDSEDDVDPGRYAKSVSSTAPGPRASHHTPAYINLRRRKLEETIIERITNRLPAEHLPGIIGIIDPENVARRSGQDELEVDLSSLDEEKLQRIQEYIDVCLSGKQEEGKRKGPRTRPSLQAPAPPPTPKQSLFSSSRLASPPPTPKPSGPISLATLSKVSYPLPPVSSSVNNVLAPPLAPVAPKKKGLRTRPTIVPANNIKDLYVPVMTAAPPASLPSRKKPTSRRKTQSRASSRSVSPVSPVPALASLAVVAPVADSTIASSRPKRKAALHKRRLLEEMLETDEEEEMRMEEERYVEVVEEAKRGPRNQQKAFFKKEQKIHCQHEEREDEDEEIDILG
ncbi:hypothetical protein BC938DRAFT_476081 [Jimgerdemannia flammicorona]|uniref:NET domain-containing protein n=1 Tax=Jimgerdemannia flammicorona TaxID=994334 RepID=A0A433PKI3_9FUNG|nr:hypothetical protein BC938DRAFT_476081 [Jimgerdemannia flammicorona]